MFWYPIMCLIALILSCSASLYTQDIYVKTQDNATLAVSRTYLPYIKIIADMVTELEATGVKVGSQAEPISLYNVTADDLAELLTILGIAKRTASNEDTTTDERLWNFIRTKPDRYRYITQLIKTGNYLLLDKDTMSILEQYITRVKKTIAYGRKIETLDTALKAGLSHVNTIAGEPLIGIKNTMLAHIFAKFLQKGNTYYTVEQIDNIKKQLYDSLHLSIEQLYVLSLLFDRFASNTLSFSSPEEIEIFKTIHNYKTQLLLIRMLFDPTQNVPSWFVTTIGSPNIFNTGWIQPIPQFKPFYIVKVDNELIDIPYDVALHMKTVLIGLSNNAGSENDPVPLPQINKTNLKYLIDLLLSIDGALRKTKQPDILKIAQSYINDFFGSKTNSSTLASELFKAGTYLQIPLVLLQLFESYTPDAQKYFFVKLEQNKQKEVLSIPKTIALDIALFKKQLLQDPTIGIRNNPLLLTGIEYTIFKTLIHCLQAAVELKTQKLLEERIFELTRVNTYGNTYFDFISQLVNAGNYLGIPTYVQKILEDLKNQVDPTLEKQEIEERPTKRQRTQYEQNQ